MDDFQPHYDVIVTGTGLTQSIIAAAASRIGKSVFHCDQNDYYSQEWQSLNFQQIINWCHSSHQSINTINANTSPSDSSLLSDGESMRSCFRKSFINNVSQISYLCDETSHEETIDSDRGGGNEELGAVGGQDQDQIPSDDQQKWSLFKFNLESRKFNLDLCPRVRY